MRRYLLTVWLACALVLVQLGAGMHQIGHPCRHSSVTAAGVPHLQADAEHATERPAADLPHLPDKARCSLCLVLGQASTLPGMAAVLASTGLQHVLLAAALPELQSQGAPPAFGNRDPPVQPG